MKNNFDSKTELIKIFDSLNREGQERLMEYANLVRCCDKYNKNVIAVNFECENDQIENSTNKPILTSFRFRQ